MTAERSTATPVWEERWHPLREEWVIVAAHRQNRPWSGEVVSSESTARAPYVADCFLCPGNSRVGGSANPHYASTFVFKNDHACVGELAPITISNPPAPYQSRRANGHARVICFSPRHDLTLAELPPAAVRDIVEVWRQQTWDLGRRPEVRHVLCFENKGAVVGVSNPHPHGQLYATNFVWKTIEIELEASRRYQAASGRGLFADILRAEQKEGHRVLFEDEHTLAFVPYFARYAYEVYVAPKRRVSHIYELTDDESISLSHALKQITVRFDNLWRAPFPYVMVLHQAPSDGADYSAYHFFIAFHPPLRQPNLLKYLAGPEIGGGNFLSDTSPEASAAALRALSPEHYGAR